ncbi:MAG: TIGR00730 family Rossman fold protein [Actinobacteria bacterium]|nr:TIGR00730 family Rossman fold protein [Actinomycetota bacterium]
MPEPALTPAGAADDVVEEASGPADDAGLAPEERPVAEAARRRGFRLPRYRTGDAEQDRRLVDVLDRTPATEDLDLLFEILASGVRLAGDDTDRLDLKITNSVLKEMRQAFAIFAPYRDVPKVTIFGSARTRADDPLYRHAAELARQLAARGWMVVTGAGPGIMQAGMEGAGRERSIGVNIRLPFEQAANEIITGDPKLVTMKYFFTRKLMLMKESLGFAALPGGFGTLDEMLELLTLQQTGKAAPAPLVLLDRPGDGYWAGWQQFVRDHVERRGYVSPGDTDLAVVTDDVTLAVDHLSGFYRNYHSIRWVGSRLVVRLKAEPTAAEIAALDERFRGLCVRGGIEATAPLRPEVDDGDHLDLPRIALALDPRLAPRLHALIAAVNALPSAAS